MAIIRKNELKTMELKQMKEKMVTLRNELMKLRSQIATRTRPENPGKVREIRRAIARMHTYTRQKQLGKIIDKNLERKTKEVKSKKQ